MKQKIPILVGILFLLSIALVSAGSGVRVSSPILNEQISGSYIIDANLTDNKLGNITQVIFAYRENTGAFTTLATVDNATPHDLNFSYTWVTTGVQDDSNITIQVNTTNSSGQIDDSNATLTGIVINNGAPTATLSSAHTSSTQKFYTDDEIVVGIAEDTTIGIDNCSYWFTSSTGTTVTSSISASGDACSAVFTPNNISLTKGANYNLLMQVFDGNNNATNSSSVTNLEIYTTDSTSSNSNYDPYAEDEQTQETQEDTSNLISAKSGVSAVTKKVVDFLHDIFQDSINWFRNLF